MPLLLALLTIALSVPILVKAQPPTGRWAAKSSVGFVGSMGMGSAVHDGKIFVFGGTDWSNGGLMDRVQVYDPSTDTWNTPTVSGYFRPSEGGAISVGDKIYVFGPDSMRIFDPGRMEWSTPISSGNYSTSGGGCNQSSCAVEYMGFWAPNLRCTILLQAPGVSQMRMGTHLRMIYLQ